jgi:transposase
MENSPNRYLFFVGIDLSKTYFDATLLNQNAKKVAYQQFKNTTVGCEEFLQWVQQKTVQLEQVLFCMEHTGIYGRLVQHFLQDHQAALWMDSGVQIKYCLGVQRGKNDRIDSFRIASYAFTRCHLGRLTPMYDTQIELLHDLLSCRNRLLGAYNTLKTAQEETKDFAPTSYSTLKEIQTKAFEGMKSSLQELDAQINVLIEKNPDWQTNLNLALSIKGLGKMTVLWLLVYTRNFSQEFNARRVAALIGVAPYAIQSGTSIDKGTHTSNFAHQHLKVILHMAAMAAIRCNPAIKIYYKRKKEEGKNGLLVLNNVKNKLIHQLLAVVRSKQLFDPDFLHPRAQLKAA